MKSLILNNFWLKVTSLVLAVLTWVYVNGELRKADYFNPSDGSPRSTPAEKTLINKDYIMERQ